MVRFYVEVDDKKLRNRLNKIEKGFELEIPKNVFEAAEFAKRVAVKLVPKDTKQTMKGIKGIVTIKNSGLTEARVGFFEPQYRGSTVKVNLPSWMTYSEGAVKGWRAYGNPKGALVHFKNGDPRFLLIAKQLAWEKFKKDVETNTGNLLHD